MRRGHPGIGGWRNDNPRHFRPRSGGTPHFRPPRGYGHAEAPRFQTPGPRPLLGPALYPPNVPTNDHMPADHHDRHGYRGNWSNQRRPPDRGQYPHQGQRQMLYHRFRQGDVPDHNFHQDTPPYFDNNKQPWETMNSKGDIDHRKPPNMPPSRPSPWASSYNYDDRSPTKSYRHQDNAEHSKIAQPDYTGHRPPSSDHYGGNQGSTMDNSNTFSRSVDDTVDIVRKRLLNRETQPLESPTQTQNEAEKSRETMSANMNSRFTNPHQDQPTKKKSHKLRNIKTNCDKIKTKIVQQLFMMDKDKIHKLMDNPNSSSKFEYAISSLVTESQNSYNRHLRSVAEKSLCSSSSTEFIHDDNNTIYEDTFMKQMQCILDPQDTVLLEDIKPMVLAELSKVLQLDDLQLRQDVQEASYSRDDHQYDQYSQDSFDNYNNFEPYSPVDSPANQPDTYFEQKPSFERCQGPEYGNIDNIDHSYNQQNFDEKPLFERRNSRKSSDRDSHSRRSSEERRRKERRSIDNRSEDNLRRSDTPVPLFDSNTTQLSDDEDPFAELDRQYHVAVDHNFIENEYMSSPRPSNRAESPVVKKEIPSQVPSPQKSLVNKPLAPTSIKTTVKPSSKIKEEIDSQLQVMAKSPLKFLSPTSKTAPETPVKVLETDIKQELMADDNSNNIPTPTKHRKSIEDSHTTANISNNHEHAPGPQVPNVTPEKSESSSSVKSTPTDSRKRSSDSKPSHRKEKRKKSESTSEDTSNKQILNKIVTIPVSDCAAKNPERSFFNLNFSKENSAKESPKDTKKIDSGDKKYSDKYVKRKEKESSSSSKKSKEKDVEVKKKHDSTSSIHSIVSSTDVSNTSTPSKADGQTKLKPIDMFVEQPKKPSVHSAHRNTSAPAAASSKVTPVELKPIVLSRKITKRHIATQVVRKCVSKETQTMQSKTEKKKSFPKGTQTDPVSFKVASQSTDPLERMKEIDMEIQALLQEKFKLYNSLENKDSGSNTMESLGMAVLNVTPDENANENDVSEDTIVDEFTSIPVEELEQIALESVQMEQNILAQKKSRRKKVQEQETKSRDSSLSTTTSTTSSRSKRNLKTHNFSLIEQIITDDRPLEDIISLDDLEDPPSKKKSQKVQSKPKKKSTKKKVTKPDHNIVHHDIKQCSVLLKRCDLNKLLQKFNKALKTKSNPQPIPEAAATAPENTEEEPNKTETCQTPPEPQASEPSAAQTAHLVEQVINDIQFDMLDVSEDIVIGEEVSLKSEEKEAGDRSTSAVCEDIILDNSQSLVDSAAAAEGSGECKTYDYSADENLRRDSITVSGNGDAVLAIECIENNFIAACLDGNVYHFSGDGKLLNTLRGSNLAVTCVTIVKEKYGTTVYTGSLDSRIRYYDLDTGMEKGPECNVLSPIQTMDRAWDTVFVGTRTGFVLQFECKNNMLIPVSTVKFSDQSILALRALKEGPRKVLLVGARSEAVTIKDAQTGLLLRTLEGPKMTVYTLLFEDGKVYCGTSSHQIHVFDYASGSHIGTHEGGKGAVCLRATGGLVFAGCYDGCVYVYREGDSTPLAQLRGPSLMLLSLAIVGTKIIAGYKDRSLYIWKIPLAILQEMIL